MIEMMIISYLLRDKIMMDTSRDTIKNSKAKMSIIRRAKRIIVVARVMAVIMHS